MSMNQSETGRKLQSWLPPALISPFPTLTALPSPVYSLDWLAD